MGVAKGAGGRGEGQGVLGMQAHPPQIEYQENLLSLWMCFSSYCYAYFCTKSAVSRLKTQTFSVKMASPQPYPLVSNV